MKKNLTGLELKYVVAELQKLAGSKVAKIYQPEKNEIYIQFYSAGTGKKLVRIAVPRFVYICEERQESPENPHGFLQSLRKHIDQSILKSVEQPGLERLVRFRFQAKEGECLLVVELFGKGNAVLCKNEETISAMESQKYKDREIRPKLKYVEPKKGTDPTGITAEELHTMLSRTEKENLATFLAVELGLGGIYAEEACRAFGKETRLDFFKAEMLQKSIKEILGRKADPAVIDKTEAVPFPLEAHKNKDIKRYQTYSEALDALLKNEVLAVDDPGIRQRQKLQKIIDAQKAAAEEMKKDIEESQRKAEFIYEHYSEVKEILERVKEDIRLPRDELIKKHNLTDVNLKDKTILVEIRE